MKSLIVLALLALTLPAHAATTTRTIETSGSMAMPADSSTSIIACKQSANPTLCYMRIGDNITPLEYVGKLGYTKLIKRGVSIQHNDIYIIMEVAK